MQPGSGQIDLVPWGGLGAPPAGCKGTNQHKSPSRTLSLRQRTIVCETDVVGRVRLLVAVVAVVLGVGISAVVLADNHSPYPVLEVVFTLVVGWTFAGAGLVAWQRRPDSRVGVLMCAVGLFWLVTLLTTSNNEWLFTIAAVPNLVPLALYGHLVLAFPTGRLGSRLARVGLAVAYLDATAMYLAVLLFVPDLCPACPANLLAVFPHPLAGQVAAWVMQLVGLALICLILVILVRRWRRASEAQRRVLSPVLGTALTLLLATFVLVFAALGAVSVPGVTTFDLVLRWIFTSAVTATALGCLVGLLRSNLDRAGVADLVVRLGRTTRPGELRQALAEALHDPSLLVLYWLGEQERFVHPDGRPATLPAAAEHGRVATVVEWDGSCVAALVHDPVVSADPRLLEAVCATAGFALANERLQAELRARLDELAASRTRLVTAADAERRRIERNLHDGAQQRLVAVSMLLGRAAARVLAEPAAAGALLGEARATLSVALQELRELSRGIHPSVLTERGLAAALEELVWATPLPVQVHCHTGGRLAEPVETTAYYVVAEALTNIAKHAEATNACIRVEQHEWTVAVSVADDGRGGADPAAGSGLAGLADRVHALEGTVDVISPPGRGTTLTVRLPCAS